MDSQSSEQKPLDKRGIWIAEPATDEFYSPGAMFIRVKKNEVSRVPRFLGEGNIRCRRDREDLLELIELVSHQMIENLPCERVYLVSLGESTSLGLHFRLLPRYREDQRILDELDADVNERNDGLALMARWRKCFLLKKKCPNGKPYCKLYKKHRDAIKKLKNL